MSDEFIMVDWSAAAHPVPDEVADSIWLAHGTADDPDIVVRHCATREDEYAAVRDSLISAVTRDRRVLTGFDFAYGYPSGFATALGHASGGEPPRLSTWKLLFGALSVDERPQCREVALQPTIPPRPFTSSVSVLLDLLRYVVVTYPLKGLNSRLPTIPRTTAGCTAWDSLDWGALLHLLRPCVVSDGTGKRDQALAGLSCPCMKVVLPTAVVPLARRECRNQRVPSVFGTDHARPRRETDPPFKRANHPVAIAVKVVRPLREREVQHLGMRFGHLHLRMQAKEFQGNDRAVDRH